MADKPLEDRRKALEEEFFEEHISKWVFRFLDDLDKYAFHKFYKDMSRLARKFLECEAEGFNAMADKGAGEGAVV